jgi:hypothetical protein
MTRTNSPRYIQVNVKSAKTLTERRFVTSLFYVQAEDQQRKRCKEEELSAGTNRILNLTPRDLIPRTFSLDEEQRLWD